MKWYEILMNSFEFSVEKEKRAFSKHFEIMLSMTISARGKRAPMTVKFVDLVRIFSKEYLTVEFQLIWF